MTERPHKMSTESVSVSNTEKTTNFVILIIIFIQEREMRVKNIREGT